MTCLACTQQFDPPDLSGDEVTCPHCATVMTIAWDYVSEETGCVWITGIKKEN